MREGFSPSVKLHNSGSITGHVSLGDGNVELVLTETSQVNGDIDLGGTGAKQATLYAGTFLDGALLSGGSSNTLTLVAGMEGGASSTRLQRVHSFDETQVQGGHWIFSDEARLGTVNVEQGHVTVEGHLMGTTVTLHKGVLDGNGVIDADVHNTGGTVAPGNSFGVLTIGSSSSADYIQGVDGVLDMEIAPSPDPQPGEHYDQLKVSGRAVFEDGTTIRIRLKPGVYRNGASYVLVDGEAEFDPEKINLVFGDQEWLFLEGNLQEGSVQLVITTVPFESVAATGNQAAVAGALTEAKDRDNTSLDELYTWLLSLAPGEEAAAQKVFESMTGEVYTALPTVAARRLESLVGSVDRGLAQVSGDGDEGGRSVWATVFGSSGRIERDRSKGTAEASFDLRGLTVGLDLKRGTGARWGLMAGFHGESLYMDERGSSAEGNRVHFGGYGQWNTGAMSLTAVLGVSKTDTDARRNVAFDGGRTAKGSFDTTDTVVSVEARFAGSDVGSLQLRPLVSLGHYTTHREKFSETGAGNLGLTVDEYQLSWVRGRLGAELAPAAQSSRLAWRARVAWVQDFSPVEREITARFNGAPSSSFQVHGTPAHSGGVELNLGLGGQMSETVSWGLEYMGEFRSDTSGHALQGRLSIGF